MDISDKIQSEAVSASEDPETLATETLDLISRASRQREEPLIPFWTDESKKISDGIWLPSKSISKETAIISPPGLSFASVPNAWFSLKERRLRKRSWLQSSSPSLLSFPENLQVPETSPVQKKGKKAKQKLLRTLKLRIFPNQTQKKILRLMFDQFRWYYNAVVEIAYGRNFLNGKFDKKKYSKTHFRDLLRKHEYAEEIQTQGSLSVVFQEFIYNEERNEFPIPDWWEKLYHNRIPRGAAAKFTYSLNAALANKENGNISDFEMKPMRKKAWTEYLHFEDTL